MTDHTDPEASRRVAIFFDTFFLPHLDAALRKLESTWDHPSTPPDIREIGIAEVKVLRADLAKQINRHGIEGCFLPPV